MLIVDAHLDLAFNAVRGRAVEKSARGQVADEQGIPSVGLPDLRTGGVDLNCATIFCLPADDKYPGYRNPQEAYAQMLQQLQWYRRMESAGQISLVHKPDDLIGPANLPRAILLLEGADPIREEPDLHMLFDAGLRIVGLSWRRTRFAGGTGAPGPLTAQGIQLIPVLDRLGIIHDTSHLAEESFWQLLDLTAGPVIASHSNCRAFVPTDRQLSDEMIRALSSRDGVIGINFFDKFLVPPPDRGRRRATLADVVAHVRHICDLAGDAAHVGLGTDMDGGFGRDQLPQEIETSADLPRLSAALSAAGFGDGDVIAIMAGNWMRFFKRNLAANQERNSAP
jgi:membrane dipeptidase